MSRVAKNTILYTIGIILPKIASFVLLPIYASYLTPGDFGIIESVHALTPILLILFSFSFGASIFRLFYDYKTEDEQKLFFGTIFISTLIISTSFLILIFIFNKFICQIFNNIPFYPFFSYVILAVFVSNLYDLPEKYLMIKNKVFFSLVLSLSRFILTACCIIWFVIHKNEGAPGFLKAGLISSLIILPVYLIISLKVIKLKFSNKIFKNVLFYSLPILPTLLGAWVLDLSDRIFIERYFSVYDVGIYSMSNKIAGMVLIIVASFNMAYRPLFFEYANSPQKKEGENIIYRLNYFFLLFFIQLSFIVAFFAKEICDFLFSENYHDVYLYIPLIIFSYFLSVALGLIARFFEQSKKLKANMYIYLGMAVLNIGLNFILIPLFGIYGGILATIMSFLIGFVVGYLYAKKHCYFVPFNFKKLIPISCLLIGIIILFQLFISINNVYYSFALKSLISIILIVGLSYKYIKDLKFLLLKKKV